MSAHENTQLFFSRNCSTNRNFGLTFSFLLFLLASWPTSIGEGVRPYLLLLGATFLLFACVKPNMLSWANLAWYRFGLILGCVTTPIILLVLFVFLFIPLGVLMRMAGGGLLLSKSKTAKSYWVNRDDGCVTLEALRRQY